VDIVRSPMLGEHTEEICTELGYSPEQLELFKRAGAI
jgi:formyl-CoA transferase